MFRPLRPLQLTVDIALALVLFAVTLPWNLGPTTNLVPGGGDPFVAPRAVAVAVVLCVGLAIRRLSPALSLAVSWVAAVAGMVSMLPPLPTNLSILGVLYACAVYGSRRGLWAGLASAVIGAGVATAYIALVMSDFSGLTASEAFGTLSLLLVAIGLALLLSWTSGALVRTARRAARNRELAERAADEAAAEAERTRIARDMHDVVAHSLAVVIAQADGARYVAASDPKATDAALRTIAGTARAALADVRVLLAQLRHRESDGPQPQLADLDELFDRMRAAGLELDARVDAGASEAGAAVQLALYRVLQEALTNALRHGAAGAVTVAVRAAPEAAELRLEVRNPVSVSTGPVAGGGGGGGVRGHGLVGMTERAALVGGSLTAGPRPGPGRSGPADAWVVAATFPRGEGAGS